ncbi:MAG: alpha/beta fold hydrolase [Oligoflexia bacterium]|nr:alpha/beta fold hydrolase [Oligoflexia bacterium]
MFDLDLVPQGLKLKEGLSWLSKLSKNVGVDASQFLEIGVSPAKRIFRENSVQVLKYTPRTETTSHPPIIIIPSLINRHYVLDILPKKSLIEFLLDQEFPVYVIEWGAPEDEDRWLTLDRLISGRLRRAINRVLEHSGADQFHLFGHCIGGTLATIYSLRYPERVISLTLVTSPMNFETGGQLASWARHPGLNLDALIQAYGNVPWPLMQTSFHMLRPAAGVTKYLRVWNKITDATFMRNFLALEAWGADNMSFPGTCYQTLIQSFYRDNALIQGNVKVAGRKVRLDQLSFPVLNISSVGDHIVPPEATLSEENLSEMSRRHLTSWTIDGGHIAAVVGKKAQRDLWPRITHWMTDWETLPS